MMEQENQGIDVGDIFIDNVYFSLNGNYDIVEVTEISVKQMFGMEGLEEIETIKYKNKLTGRIKEVTMDSFTSKFKSVIEIRDEKLTKLLNG